MQKGILYYGPLQALFLPYTLLGKASKVYYAFKIFLLKIFFVLF